MRPWTALASARRVTNCVATVHSISGICTSRTRNPRRRKAAAAASTWRDIGGCALRGGAARRDARRRGGHDPVEGNAPEWGLEADAAAERRRHADGSPGVRAEGAGAQAGHYGDGRPAARTAGAAAGIVGV